VELGKFGELEGKIRSLMAQYDGLKKKNQELEVLLNNKSLELEEVKKQLKGINEERDAARTKIDSLLDLLQDINVPG
jgi:uncharacterized coiled-coil DUF342 family protein